jgi:hypothetical protein
MGSVAATKKPLTVTEPASEKQQQEEAIAPPKPTTDLKVSDSLAEPLRVFGCSRKSNKNWVTVRDIQRKRLCRLKGKKSEQIQQYLGTTC